MKDIASHVLHWTDSGTGATVARFVDISGFGGRRSNEAMAISTTGERFGSLLGGSVNADLAAVAATVSLGNGVVLDVTVSDNDAVGCGLACGGRASVLVQSSNDIPMAAWRAMARGETIVLATMVSGDDIGRTIVVTPDGTLDGTLGDPAVTLEAVHAAQAMLTRPKDVTRTVMTDAGPVFVSLVRPPTHVIVLGEAALADALAAQSRLLGWSCEVVSDRVSLSDLTASVANLGPGDALVALSHDLDASCGAMAAALAGRCGYVGGLGSRHTQTARATRLIDVHGLDEQVVSKIHGPVGLDLGSRTSEETALAIAAEIVAALAGRSAASLSGSTGPING